MKSLTISYFVCLTLAVDNSLAGFVRITKCTASYNQVIPGWHKPCETTFDGIVDELNNGWATGPEMLPQHVVYDLEYGVQLQSILMVTAIEREKQFITKFKVEVQYVC